MKSVPAITKHSQIKTQMDLLEAGRRTNPQMGLPSPTETNKRQMKEKVDFIFRDNMRTDC